MWAGMCVQEKVLAQLEKEGKSTKAEKKPEKAAEDTKSEEGALAAVKEEEEDEEEEDPVEAALTKYGIITENPWEKGVKYVSHLHVCMY